MVRKKVYTQQMLTRVLDFGTNHAEFFPEESAAGELLAAIGRGVSALSGHSSDQVSGDGSVRTSSVSRLAARKVLQQKLARMDQTAHALKLEQFYMPRNRSDSALIDAGVAFARDAEPLKDAFVKQGLPAGFIENLKTAVQGLEGATRDLAVSKGKRKAAIEGFDNTLKQVLDDLERFEALVTNTLSDNPQLMAEWKVARRVFRPPVKRKPVPAPEPSPSPQPDPPHVAS